MNLRQLKYFVKIVELGNMTRAAESLFVAQPALGMQIRQLEERLGVSLLIRHSRGVEPTPAGALLYERALAILNLVDKTGAEVSARDRVSTEAVRLGLTPMLMLVIGPELLVKVRDLIPKVSLSLIEEMSHVLIDALARGETDLALAYDVPDVPHLTRTELLREDLAFVAQSSARNGQPICFAATMREQLALPEKGDTVRDLVERSSRDLGLEPKLAFEVRSVTAIKNLILRGAAAGILPFGSVIDEVRGGRLDARPIVAPPLRRSLFLVAKSKRNRFECEPELTDVIRSSLTTLTDVLGPLAHAVPERARGTLHDAG